MAESLGVALLELGTDDRKLKKGLGKAEKSAKRTAGRIKKAFAGLATAALITGIKRAFDTAIDRLDNIAKSADKIGIATDALQELRVAADLSGVSSQALDTALRKFSRSVDEAGQGVIEYKEVFDRLGISVLDARGEIKPITDLVGEVADAMGKVGNTTSRAAIALDLFGRSGVDMLNLFAGGAEGIDEMREAARKLGIIFDESLIREAVIAKDELTLLAKVLEFDMTVALRRLAPLIIGITELLVFLSTAAGNAAEGFRRFFTGTLFAEEIDNITKSLKIERAELADLASDLKVFGETGDVSKFLALKVGVTGAETFDELFEKVRVFRAGIDAEITALEARMTQLGGGLTDVDPPPPPPPPPGIGDGGPTDFDLGLVELRERIKLLGQEQQLAGKSALQQALLNAEYDKERILLEFSNLAKDNGAALTIRQIAQVKKLADSFKDEAVALAILNDVLEKNAEVQREAARAAEETRFEIEEITDEILGPFQDALKDGQLNFESFASALETIAIRMKDRMIDEAFKPLEEALDAFLLKLAGADSSGGGILGKIFGGLFSALGGGGSSGTGSGTAGAFAGLLAGGSGRVGGGREHGGSVQAGRAFIVGERRPELFIPHTSGTILPRVPGGGLTININQPIDARGAVEGTAAQIQSALVENNKRLPDIVRNAQRRGM